MKIKKYRLKDEFEAARLDYTHKASQKDNCAIRKWIGNKIKSATYLSVSIDTIDGYCKVTMGDYIVKDKNGNFSGLTEKDFNETYIEVTE